MAFLFAALAMTAWSQDETDSRSMAPTTYTHLECSGEAECVYNGTGAGVFYSCKDSGECHCGNAEYCECSSNGACYCDNSTYCNCKNGNGECNGANTRNLYCSETNGLCCYQNATTLLSKRRHHAIMTEDGVCYGWGHSGGELSSGAIVGIVLGSLALIVLCLLGTACILRRCCKCCCCCKKKTFERTEGCEAPTSTPMPVKIEEGQLPTLPQIPVAVPYSSSTVVPSNPKIVLHPAYPGGYGAINSANPFAPAPNGQPQQLVFYIAQPQGFNQS